MRLSNLLLAGTLAAAPMAALADQFPKVNGVGQMDGNGPTGIIQECVTAVGADIGAGVSSTTLSTNTASNADLVYTFNGTNWTLAA
jgi:hypothetical protein